MSKLDLKNVTFVCGDSIPKHKLVIESIIKKVSSNINFGDIIFKSTGIKSIRDYNLFCAKGLNDMIKTDYCLVFQWDGYPINVSAWDDDWFSYDYIGAPWITQPWSLDKTVGNGGFSLRSKKYLEECSKADYNGTEAEDVFFCRNNKLDCRYAPVSVAYQFSVEDLPYKGQFGFHGKATIEMNKRLGIF